MYRASRVAWRLHLGQIPEGLMVLHRCDVPGCVNPGHLFLGDAWVNIHDAMAKGRRVTGERHHNARLTDSEVEQVRSLEEQGWTPKSIQQAYVIPKTTYYRIRRREARFA
jgi:hypothetical protein